MIVPIRWCALVLILCSALTAVEPVSATATIVYQGGGVRGVGLLARYAAPGPGTVAVRRTTTVAPNEPYPPICVVRVLDPNGSTVAWQELSDQPTGTTIATLSVPAGPAGIWRVSVSGGRGNPYSNPDVIAFTVPGTTSWGIRGEMALGGVSGTWWLWVPPTVTSIIAKSDYGPPGLSFATAAGASLPTSAPASSAQVLATPPTSTAITITRASGAGAVALDGVPGLWCPTQASAQDLRGGTVDTGGGWIVAGPLQARARAWMVAALARPMTPTLTFPASVPADLANPQQEAQLYGGYAPLSNLATSLTKQNLDSTSPEFGSFNPPATPVDWRSFLHGSTSGHFDASGLAAAVACPGVLNPAYGNAVLRDRATLAAFRHLTGMQGDELLRESDLQAQRDPTTYGYFIYEGSLANPLRLVDAGLDAQARAIWRDGLIAVGDKLADHQGYQSNQFMHTIIGHLHTYQATGEVRFLGYFERLMTAFCTGAFGPNHKFGQHPAGYYLEEFGPDGNYDSISGALLATAYTSYASLSAANPVVVARMRASLSANHLFRSHFWLPQPDGSLLCATQFNSRQDSMFCAEGWPAMSMARADFPLARRRWQMTVEGSGSFPGNIFPSLITNDDWARRQLAHQVPRADRGNTGNGVNAVWTADAWEVAGRPVTVTAATDLPWEVDGVRELPGLVSWHQGPLVTTVLYDVTGAGAASILTGKFGGGPTQIWSPATGLVVAGLRNANPAAHGRIDGPDTLTSACIAGTTDGGGFFWTGSERSALHWVTANQHARITGTARAPLSGTITWDYESSWGAITITAALSGTDVQDAYVNLPVPLQVGAGNVIVSGSTITLGGHSLNVVLPTGTIPTISADLAAVPHAVRCLRIPLSGSASARSVRFSLVVPTALPTPGRPRVIGGSLTVPILSGTTIPDVSVQVLVDGSDDGAVTADGTGIWHATLSSLTPGVHAVTVRCSDAFGRSSAPSSPLTLSTVLGDADADGAVTTTDRTLVRAQFGRRGADIIDARADLNHDDRVDGLDLGVVLRALP